MDYIAERVAKLVATHGTRDPFVICKNLKVFIMYQEMDTSIKAFYFSYGDSSRIVLNTAIDETLYPTLVAHELGHHLEHRSISLANSFKEFELYSSQVPVEYEANLFAAELLVSDDEVVELLNDEESSFYRTAWELGIPAELLDFKFRLLMHKGYRITPLYLANSNFLKRKL